MSVAPAHSSIEVTAPALMVLTALFEGGHVNIAKIIPTYAVPYCVATYGAVSYRLSTNERLNSR